jgi:hypothetical protein
MVELTVVTACWPAVDGGGAATTTVGGGAEATGGEETTVKGGDGDGGGGDGGGEEATCGGGEATDPASHSTASNASAPAWVACVAATDNPLSILIAFTRWGAPQIEKPESSEESSLVKVMVEPADT